MTRAEWFLLLVDILTALCFAWLSGHDSGYAEGYRDGLRQNFHDRRAPASGDEKP